MKLISVIMSVYNETERMLRESIESILKQTYQKLEYIIVLDNPDNAMAKKVLSEYAQSDDRIRILENQKNIGLALSLNRALEQARGDYIARMDADDVSALDRLQREVERLEAGGYDVVCTGVNIVEEEGALVCPYPIASEAPSLIKEVLPYCCIVIHPTVMMRTSVLRAVGGYRNFYAAQDYDLWLRLLSLGYKFGCIRNPLLNYRVRNESVTGSRAFVQQESARYIRKLYRQRMRKKADSYSWDNYKLYLKRRGLDSERLIKKFSQTKGMCLKARKKAKEGDFKGAIVCALKGLRGFKWEWYSLRLVFIKKRIESKYAGCK